MKKDNLKELLYEKLARTEVKPPSDVWARLERQLPEIRRELAFGGGEGAPGSPDALRAPRIRRPLRQKMRWAYVAASVAAVGVMIFTARNLGELETTVAEVENRAAVIEKSATTENTDPGTVTDPVIEILRPISGRANSIATAGQTQAEPVVDERVPADPSAEPSVDESGGAGNTDAQPESNTRKAQDRAEDHSQPKNRDDLRPRDFMDDYTDLYPRRSRRNTTISASLYASNSTSISGSNTITGRTKLMQSSLIVTEKTEYPGEEAGTNIMSSFSGKLKHDLPLGFGASVNIGLFDRLSLETGLTYTFMKSKGESSTNNSRYVIDQKLHYLGIPVKVKYDFVRTRFVDVYAAGGFSIEKLVYGKQTASDYYDNVKQTTLSEKVKVGSLQTSVGANIGLEFNIDKRLGLYAEPGVGYFFKNGNQPESYRTENPFNFTIKAGFRIKL
ncbi:MAG: porin family protein [Rikenellaceae bacterium]|nr:porin family protein [Rikenellaceae bacterium]